MKHAKKRSEVELSQTIIFQTVNLAIIFFD